MHLSVELVFKRLSGAALGGTVAVLFFACTTKPTPVSLLLNFESESVKERWSTIDVTIVKGQCESDAVLYSAQIQRSGAVPTPPRPVASGTYSVRASARDSSCMIFADSCTTFEAPLGDDDNLTVTLRSKTPEVFDSQCTPQTIGNPQDSGTSMDGATMDAGADTGMVDTGMDAAPDSMVDSSQPPPACAPSQCRGRRCVSGQCGYFPSCKQLHNDAYGATLPSGYYYFDSDNAGATFGEYKTFCDMNTAGGGWTLVARSQWGAGAGNFGWQETRGQADNFSDAFSLNVSNHGLTGFTEILLGTYFVSGSNTLGDQAYRLTVGANFVSSTSNSSRNVGTITTVNGNCQGGLGVPSMISNWGYTQKNTVYFMRDSDDPGWDLGLLPYGYDLFYDDCNGGGNMYTNPSNGDYFQGLIFVR